MLTTAAELLLEDVEATATANATAAAKAATAAAAPPLPVRVRCAIITSSSVTRQKSANLGAFSMRNTQRQKARPAARTRE